MTGRALSSSLLLLAAWGAAALGQEKANSPCAQPVAPVQAGRTVASADGETQFGLAGLISPATVAGSIFLSAPKLGRGAAVTYFLDDQLLATSSAYPFRLQREGHSQGYSLAGVHPGVHRLCAEARVATGGTIRSNVLELEVVGTINDRLSAGLNAYANQPGAQSKTLETVLRDTSTVEAKVSGPEVEVRKKVLRMYLNWGIDPSIDRGNDQSELLVSLNPQGWSPTHRAPGAVPLSMLFSPDAPFYQPIPTAWPRVLLPAGYFQQLQLNTVKAGDGIGFGEVVARSGDAEHMVRSQWYQNEATLRTYPFRMPAGWHEAMPWQTQGDMHMIFVDPESDSFVSSYKTSLNTKTGGPNALYATAPTKLGTLGDRGGSIAAHFAELPALLQPGEATDPAQPIRHALGGSVSRTWAARVYPANAWDSGVLTSVNTCTGSGFTNTGLVPYGGVIQLDPNLDLRALRLTLPALRILEAIQTYGYYVEDFGCTDLDIYTAVSETEFDPYGGLWGYNRRGIGVQNEVRDVLMKNKLYVVAPLTKKQ
jgi:hypothetical protein